MLGKALGGGDTICRQTLPSWSLPFEGRLSCLFVIDGVKIVKQRDLVSGVYCCMIRHPKTPRFRAKIIQFAHSSTIRVELGRVVLLLTLLMVPV